MSTGASVRRSVCTTQDVRVLEGADSPDLVYFSSVSENTRRFVDRLDRDAVLGGLLSLLGVLLRAEDAMDRAKLDRFIEVSHRAGPPPAFGARPFIPPQS